MAHLFVMKVARLRDRIREECTNYVLHNHHGLFMHQLLHLMSSKLAMNDQILGHTEYKIHLLSDLRVYCPTSEFTVRPQSLLSDLRVYCPTSEFTVRPQNLLSDLRVLLYDLGFWKYKF